MGLPVSLQKKNLKAGDITQKNKTNTWNFEADNVTDWATLSEFNLYQYIDTVNLLDYDIESVNGTAGIDQDVPIMTLTPQLYGKARYSNKDLKPALGFLYIREMLGEKVFEKSLRLFIDTWKGKHPTPWNNSVRL